jgi:hypothetical protein
VAAITSTTTLVVYNNPETPVEAPPAVDVDWEGWIVRAVKRRIQIET